MNLVVEGLMVLVESGVPINKIVDNVTTNLRQRVASVTFFEFCDAMNRFTMEGNRFAAVKYVRAISYRKGKKTQFSLRKALDIVNAFFNNDDVHVSID